MKHLEQEGLVLSRKSTVLASKWTLAVAVQETMKHMVSRSAPRALVLIWEWTLPLARGEPPRWPEDGNEKRIPAQAR